MRTKRAALAALVLALLCGPAQAQQPAPAAEPQAGQPGVQAPDDDAPPPFVKRPPLPPRAKRADLTYAQGKSPVEFRGLPWGTSLEAARAQAQDLAPVTSPVTLKNTYSRAGETLKLGEADIRSVAYYFPKGKLAGVGIVFEGEANYFLIKEHLIRQFGPGRQMGDRYGWTWPDFFVEMRLRGSQGELRYTYVP